MHPKINLLGFAPVLVPMPMLVPVPMLVLVLMMIVPMLMPVLVLVPVPCLDKILFDDFCDFLDLGQSCANINDL